MHLDRGAAQHQCRLIHQIQSHQDIRHIRRFSHTPASIQARKRLYTRCRAPNCSGSWYAGIQLVQDPVEYFTPAFPGPASVGLLFWRQKILIRFRCASLIPCRFTALTLTYPQCTRNNTPQAHGDRALAATARLRPNGPTNPCCTLCTEGIMIR